MPFYQYRCRKCGNEKQKMKKPDEGRKYTEPCDKCDGTLEFTFGKAHAQAKETADEYRGKSVEMGISDKILERSNEHFRKHELPRLIEKHGKEWGIRNGHLDIEGNPVKK